MRCSSLSILLAESSGAIDALRPAEAHHVQSCLRCQAEAAHYRRLERGLSGLRSDLIFPDPHLYLEFRNSLRPLAEVHEIHRKSRRRVYLSGFAAAATAGAAGAIVIASRLVAKQKIAS